MDLTSCIGSRKHSVQFRPGNVLGCYFIARHAENDGDIFSVFNNLDINTLVCKMRTGIAFLLDRRVFLLADVGNVGWDQAIDALGVLH